MVIFQIFFLACKLYKSGLYITRYFRHGQCFIWEFSVLAFIETARLNTASFRNFSWPEKTLILDHIYIDRFLLVAFIKYILSQIYRTVQKCNFQYFLEIVETFVFENIFKVLLYLCFFFVEKTVTSITQK